MMDCSRLRLSIPTYRMSDDGSTHTYGINVIYGKLKWDVFHRFSEYLSLYDRLIHCSLEAVPSPPPKSIGRPQTSALLEERRVMLETWIKALCIRPDIRTSNPFVEFIEFELHTSCSVQQLSPYLQAICQDAKFQLSDFQWVPASRAIFASYEEAPSIARLGKVWSLVESEDLGSLSVWSLPPLEDSNWNYEHSLHESSIEEPYFGQLLHSNTHHRCHSIYFHEVTGRIFVGLETGTIEVYRFPARTERLDGIGHNDQNRGVTETFCGLEKEEQLNLHTEAVMSIRGNNSGPGRILTVGFDKAVRVVNCLTLETLSGGKLNKRLASGHHLTLGVLENVTTEEEFMKSRMFIGTSNGSVFIILSMVNPSEWIYTIEGNGNDLPITALEVAGSSLLVAQKYTLSIYRVGKPLEECKVTCTAKYQPEIKMGRTIRSIAVSRTTPLLFLGHTRAISVWDCREGACVCSFKAHSNGIRRLHVLENKEMTQDARSPYAGRQLQLLSGGSDGSLKLWKLSNVDELKLWKPETVTALDERQQSTPRSPGRCNSEVNGKIPSTTSKFPPNSEYDQLSCPQQNSFTTNGLDDGTTKEEPFENLNKKETEETTSRQRSCGLLSFPPKRSLEAFTDEEDSLFSTDLKQVAPHRH